MTPSWRSSWAPGRSGWSSTSAARAAARFRRAKHRGGAASPRRAVRRVRQRRRWSEIVDACERLRLTLLQLHGDEGPSFCSEAARRTGARVIKALQVVGVGDVRDAERFHTDFHLLDARSASTGKEYLRGGTGETFDWGLLAARRSKTPLILERRPRRRATSPRRSSASTRSPWTPPAPPSPRPGTRTQPSCATSSPR